MGRVMDSLSTINSFLRTLLALVVVGGVGTAGWYGYSTYHAKEFEAAKKAAALAESEKSLADARQQLTQAEATVARHTAELVLKNAEIVKLNESVKKLETALYYLKVDHRVARFTAVDQTKDDATGDIATLIEFVELNDEGQPIDTPRQFRIQ